MRRFIFCLAALAISIVLPVLPVASPGPGGGSVREKFHPRLDTEALHLIVERGYPSDLLIKPEPIGNGWLKFSRCILTDYLHTTSQQYKDGHWSVRHDYFDIHWEKYVELRFWSPKNGFLSLPAIVLADVDNDEQVDLAFAFNYVYNDWQKLLNLKTRLERIPGIEGDIFEVDLKKLLEDIEPVLRKMTHV